MKERSLESINNTYRSVKQAAWKRFQHEYLVALRERHNLNHKGKDTNIQIGDVVIIKVESKNRGNWKLAIVE